MYGVADDGFESLSLSQPPKSIAPHKLATATSSVRALSNCMEERRGLPPGAQNLGPCKRKREVLSYPVSLSPISNHPWQNGDVAGFRRNPESPKHCL